MRSTEELCGSYEQNAAKTRDLGSEALDRGAFPVAATVWGESALSYLMRAMLGWRAAMDDPRPWLDGCIEVSELAVERLAAQPVWIKQFNHAPGSFSALLRGRYSSQTISSHVSIGLVAGATPPGAAADASLVRGLAEGEWDATPTPEATGRLALMSKTFATYAALARNGADLTDRLRLTSDAVSNYRARRKNGYYVGGLRSEGGGEYNELLVDYRLAAIWHRYGWPAEDVDSDTRVHLLPDFD